MSLREKSQDLPAPNETADTADSSMSWQEQPGIALFNPTYQELIELSVKDCNEAQKK